MCWIVFGESSALSFENREPRARYSSQPRIGLMPCVVARLVEVDEPVERAVVGDRERRHPELDGLRDELA